MSETDTAEAPAADSDTTTGDSSKAYKISEHRLGRVVVTLLGKDVKKQDGTEFTKKFYNVEKIYKDSDDKWQSTSYFEENELSLLPLAIDEARRAMHTK